jgi:hypothetical protein
MHLNWRRASLSCFTEVGYKKLTKSHHGRRCHFTMVCETSVKGLTCSGPSIAVRDRGKESVVKSSMLSIWACFCGKEHAAPQADGTLVVAVRLGNLLSPDSPWGTEVRYG